MKANSGSRVLDALHGPDGPGLRAMMTQLVGQYGEKEVLAAFKSVTRKKPGPKRMYLAELHDIAFDDALDWLNGKNPKRVRTNNRLAEAVSSQASGRAQRSSAHRTMMRLLSAERDILMLLMAASVADRAYPIAVSMKARAELAKIGKRELAEHMLWQAESMVREYRRKLGEPPADLSLSALSQAAFDAPEPQNALLAAQRSIPFSRG